MSYYSESPIDIPVNFETSSNKSRPYHHQIPPYGKQGEPYVITRYGMLYPQNSDSDLITTTDTSSSTSLWKFLRTNTLITELDKCFPFVYLMTHGMAMLLNSVVQIALQITTMGLNGALWYVASGIWAGVYFFITAILTLALVQYRNYWLYVVTYILHLFGILMVIGAYLVVNALAISYYDPDCTNNCYNVNMKPIDYVMFFLGVLLLIMIIIFLIIMPCFILNIFADYRKFKQFRYSFRPSNVATIDENLMPPDHLKHAYLYQQNSLTQNGSAQLLRPSDPHYINHVLISYKSTV